MESCATCNRSFSRAAIRNHQRFCSLHVSDNPNYASQKAADGLQVGKDGTLPGIDLQEAVRTYMEEEEARAIRQTLPSFSILPPSPRTIFERARAMNKAIKAPILSPTPREDDGSNGSGEKKSAPTRPRVVAARLNSQPNNKSWF
jgi:hypothetical protein